MIKVILKMDLGVGEMGNILWLTPSPCDKNSGERSSTHGPSSYLVHPDFTASIIIVISICLKMVKTNPLSYVVFSAPRCRISLCGDS